MTTKSDYVGSILQGLAAVTLSNPSHELLAAIDRAMHEFQSKIDPEGRNSMFSVEDATEIIADYLECEDGEEFTIEQWNFSGHDEDSMPEKFSGNEDKDSMPE